MRSSTSPRDRQRAGAALLAALCLSVGLWLILTRPMVARFPSRSDVAPDTVETRSSADVRPASPGDAPPPSLSSRSSAARAPRWSPPWAPSPAPSAAPEAEAPEAEAPDVEAPAPAAPATPRVDLAGVLRASGLACLGGREALLSPTERELCRERLGAQAERTPSLAESIDLDKRADYDTVAQAGAGRSMVPLAARGAGGGLTSDDRARTSRKPKLGCSMKFGLNADQGSGDALHLGPCVIRTPMSAPNADTNPRRPY